MDHKKPPMMTNKLWIVDWFGRTCLQFVDHFHITDSWIYWYPFHRQYSREQPFNLTSPLKDGHDCDLSFVNINIDVIFSWIVSSVTLDGQIPLNLNKDNIYVSRKYFPFCHKQSLIVLYFIPNMIDLL